jgi:alpha-galactosidase
VTGERARVAVPADPADGAVGRPAKPSRRAFLQVALASPALAGLASVGRAGRPGLDRLALVRSPASAIGIDGTQAAEIEVVRNWNGPFCSARAVHRGRAAVRLNEIVLFDVPLTVPPDTRFYGEGFQMLTQTGGTLGHPVGLSSYTDVGHYKIPQPEGARAFYGLITLTPPGQPTSVLAFTSCARFSGRLQVRASSVQVVLEAEGLEIRPGEAWPLEEFMFAVGPDRSRLLDDVAARLARNHPRPPAPLPPTGWCSWYCFGPKVTARQVLDNLDAIAKTVPGLRYIQIDDGYQRAMGDWLESGPAFEGGVQTVLEHIRGRGFEPAIWVAPFVAEAGSHVFQEHPGWFIADDAGEPLRADRVTFGGWRRGPWYALDGTHPEVQQHFERLFRTMRNAWGCTYFKLDANFWGAMHGGRFHDPRATRVEAYRRGMQAIARGAGDAFLLGCNHPIWPSIGTIHGSRSSNDIKRSWDRIASTGRQNLSRNWQNGRLWWNDPDAIVLIGDLPENEFLFHAAVVYASGGMVLSGDDLTRLSADRLAILRRLLPPTGLAAEFEDDSLQIGVIRFPDRRHVCFLNWYDLPQTITSRLPRHSEVTDLWTGESLGRRNVLSLNLAPRSARVFSCH